MPIKLRHILLLLFINTLKVRSQTCDTATFQRYYLVQNTERTPAQKIVSDKDGSNYILANTVVSPESPSSSIDGLIMKTNKRGTVLWTKHLGFIKNDVLDEIVLSKDGGVIVTGHTNSYSDGEGWVCKLNTDGNLQWSYRLGNLVSSLGKIIALPGGGFAMVGSILLDYTKDAYGNIVDAKRGHSIAIIINADGSVRWSKEFFISGPGNVDIASSILLLSDGNILFLGSSGDRTINTQPDGGTIMKMNITDGTAIWQKKSVSFWPEYAKELTGGDIRLYSSTTMLQLDRDGNKKWDKEITLNTYTGYTRIIENTSVNSAEDFFLYAFPAGKAIKPVLFKLKDTSRIEWAHEYLDVNPSGYINNPSAFFYNNQFFICASLEFDDIKPYLSKAYIIQTDAGGNTPCSGNYPLSVTNTKPANISVLDMNFTYVEPGPKLFKIPVYANPLLSEQGIDCYKVSCCRDTVIKKDVQICSGASYILPDGTKVDSTSVYSNRLNSSTGCDSIIYTSLYVKQPIKFSLGNDTCFQSNNTIKYTLSFTPNHVQYHWQDGSTDSAFIISIAGNYAVKVNDECSSHSDTVTIFKDCALPIQIPTAFTPNGDGKNDVFRIANLNNQKLISFCVFNRVGEKIFSGNDPYKGWDGKFNGTLMPPGTFVYMIVYADLRRVTHTIKGAFVLIR